MNMNRYIYTLMAAVALLLGITACNEKLSMFEANQNPPEVTDFSPKNGVQEQRSVSRALTCKR